MTTSVSVIGLESRNQVSSGASSTKRIPQVACQQQRRLPDASATQTTPNAQ
jgi:hypothetical protein